MAPRPNIRQLLNAAIRFRRLAELLGDGSAVTVALLALADRCDQLIDDTDRAEAQEAYQLLTNLLEQYIRMGLLLGEAQNCLSVIEYEQFLSDQGINADLAEHTITLAEQEG
jgi:hypothetical protein